MSGNLCPSICLLAKRTIDGHRRIQITLGSLWFGTDRPSVCGFRAAPRYAQRWLRQTLVFSILRQEGCIEGSHYQVSSPFAGLLTTHGPQRRRSSSFASFLPTAQQVQYGRRELALAAAETRLAKLICCPHGDSRTSLTARSISNSIRKSDPNMPVNTGKFSARCAALVLTDAPHLAAMPARNTLIGSLCA